MTTSKEAIAAARERFWSKVNKNGPVPASNPKLGKCWLWTAARNKRDGRARFFLNGKMFNAARAMKILSGVAFKDGEMACHKCDNNLCVRPSHVFNGDALSNMQDKVAKRRHGAWIKPWDFHRAGKKSWNSRSGVSRNKFRFARMKLSKPQIRKILASSASHYSLAKVYSVDPKAIARLRSGQTYKHILQSL